jgi:uncharacterized protein (DUF924 family)
MRAPADIASARKVLDFWFQDRVEKRWFDPDPELDREIVEKFGDLYRFAREGELSDWTKTAETALALVILLDQFPRNMFRGHADSFASDAQARAVTRHAIAHNVDLEVDTAMREFFYTPLMHSEDLCDQDWCVELIEARLGGKEGKNYPFALQHRDIIRRFGRFPARNAALGRASTAEELAFLAAQKSG